MMRLGQLALWYKLISLGLPGLNTINKSYLKEERYVSNDICREVRIRI